MRGMTFLRHTLMCIFLTLCFTTVFASEVSSVKLLADGQQVSLSNLIVSHAANNCFYVQDLNGLASIQVQMTNHGFVAGWHANIQGTMRTNAAGERYIQATAILREGTSTTPVRPLYMALKALGGQDWHYDPTTGAGQRGVFSSTGLNNVGALIKVSGRVTYIDRQSSIAYIDDGSGLNDGNMLGENGNPVHGVRVLLPDGISMRSVGSPITLTGISSIAEVNGNVAKAIRPCSFTGEVISIPPGTFTMGNTMTGDDLYSVQQWEWNKDELPQHEVTLTNGYLMSKYEVTRAEYRQFINAGGYYHPKYWSTDGWNWRTTNNRTEPDNWAPEQNWGDPPGPFVQTERYPVVGISYYEADAFCRWAGGSLPTEAEWERAARWTGTTELIYPWGNTWHGNYCNDAFDPIYQRYMTAPVGSYREGASPSGCMDMAGNVWEWCKDWYLIPYFSQTPQTGWIDPQGPDSSPQGYRVLRGGSWNFGAADARCGNRYHCEPGSYRYFHTGSWRDVGIRVRQSH